MSWTSLLLAGFFLLVFLPLAMVVFVAMFGRVSGSEFSPNTFEQRQFSYYEIPFVKIQVMPVQRSAVPSGLHNLLMANSLIPPSKTPDRWDLVATNQTEGYSPECDAAILANYLNDDPWAGNRWTLWTEEHADLANVFWAKVADMARFSRYLIIPSLFRAAERADSAKELEAELIQLCTTEIEIAAVEWSNQGQTDQAVRAYEYLIALDPENQTYQQALEKLTPKP